MKPTTFILLILSFFLLGASNSDITFEYKPVLMNRSELEKSVLYLSARPITNPGKIYYKDQTIFLIEKNKGIHVIDNSNPKDPKQTGFINVPGCVDISIKNQSLYTDNAVDLVTIDISNYPDVVVTKRIKDVFPELPPPGYDYVPYEFTEGERPENTVIVNWETR